jgi:hypothetical protein
MAHLLLAYWHNLEGAAKASQSRAIHSACNSASPLGFGVNRSELPEVQTK